MAQQYANTQPSGFQNQLKNVAIVGASALHLDHYTLFKLTS